jgi:signal recognition particle GTPase
LGKQLDIPVFHSRDIKNPAEHAIWARKKATVEARVIVILDTEADSTLMRPYGPAQRGACKGKAHEVILWFDYMTGQMRNLAKVLLKL